MAVVAGGVGFVSYNAAAGTFSMSASRSKTAPVHMAGGFYSLSAIYCDEKSAMARGKPCFKPFTQLVAPDPTRRPR